ncbi:hypothetical protein FJY68_13295 [candidate division WOR-3 bacterium]|uniref:Uncharacterized protein n=1 Tax=candidate division WOR-3 bacterium TaxID=2052148 RepID=A0A937XK46_UNCW3|nr:hypothetical protein [candidate division WOR-3 bacterium]
MSNSDKKRWSTPQLRVFARTRAEEMVLAACKGVSIKGSPYDTYNGCFKDSGLAAPCAVPCSNIASS